MCARQTNIVWLCVRLFSCHRCVNIFSTRCSLPSQCRLMINHWPRWKPAGSGPAGPLTHAANLPAEEDNLKVLAERRFESSPAKYSAARAAGHASALNGGARCVKSSRTKLSTRFRFLFRFKLKYPSTVSDRVKGTKCSDDPGGRSNPDRQEAGQDGVPKQHGEAGALTRAVGWRRVSRRVLVLHRKGPRAE